MRSPVNPSARHQGKVSSAHFLWGLPGSFNARPSRVELGWYWESDEAGSGVAGPASGPSAFDRGYRRTISRKLPLIDPFVIFSGELSHKFVPSCCRNLLGEEEGKAGREGSSAEDGHGRRLAEPRLEDGG